MLASSLVCGFPKTREYVLCQDDTRNTQGTNSISSESDSLSEMCSATAKSLSLKPVPTSSVSTFVLLVVLRPDILSRSESTSGSKPCSLLLRLLGFCLKKNETPQDQKGDLDSNALLMIPCFLFLLINKRSKRMKKV